MSEETKQTTIISGRPTVALEDGTVIKSVTIREMLSEMWDEAHKDDKLSHPPVDH